MFRLSMALCLVGSLAWAEAAKVFPLADKSRANLETRLVYVLSLSEADMLAIVPTQSGIFFTDCPGCDAGMADSGDWEWDPKTPTRIRCKTCGAVYPNNPRFPDDKAIEVRAPGGVHRYPYYENAQGYRIFFRAKADYFAASYMAEVCRDLGQLYRITGEERYARRAALILARFAEVYPTWAYKFDYPFREKTFSPYDRNRVPGAPEYRTSRWGAWAYYGISTELLEGYDAVCSWAGLDALAGGRARHAIETDLFISMVEFVMGFEETYSNMSPGMWRRFILAGRVMNRPEWISEAMQRLDQFIGSQFLYDGCWREPSLAYGKQVYGNLANVYAALPEYEPPATAAEGARNDLREVIERNRLALVPLRRAWEQVRLPDGGELPIHDTWRKRRPTMKRTGPLLMGGLGVAMMGGRGDERPVCAWLNFSGGLGHTHNDALSIGLFAADADLLSDIGYTHTAWRAWAVMTHSHNTVVVNGLRSGLDAKRALNRARLFVTDGEGFHVAEAESDAAYPGVTQRYRRTLLLVGKDSGDAYLIDVFQVHGGEQHDYLLLGPVDEDAHGAVSGATLAPFSGSLMNPGTVFTLPKAESERVSPAGGYGFVRNLNRGAAHGPVVLDMRIAQRPETGVQTRLLAGSGTHVYLGEAPGIRRAGSNDGALDKYYAPFFCARRKGANLQSLFLATHEVVNSAPKIRTIAAEQRDGAVFVTVDRGEHGRDYFVMALDAPMARTFQTADGPLAFDGAYGLVRVKKDGTRAEAHLVGGARLSLGGALLEGHPGHSGRILKVVRQRSENSGGWFEVEAKLSGPAQSALIVEFSDRTVRAYNVTLVEATPEGTRLHVAEDPGFVIEDGRVRLLTFPHRDVAGAEVRYSLPGAAHWR